MRDYTGSQGAVYWSMGGGVLWWSPVSHEGLYRLSVCRLMVYEWSYSIGSWGGLKCHIREYTGSQGTVLWSMSGSIGS